MQLTDNHAFRAINDEYPVVGHQGEIPEVDLLLFDVANGLDFRIAVLVPHHQTNRHLQGSGISHAPLLAFADVVFEGQLNGIPAIVTALDLVGVSGSAVPASHIFNGVGAQAQRPTAISARPPKVLKTLQLATFAFPLADGIIHKLQGGGPPKIADREHGIQHRLQPRIIPLRGQQIHLQKSSVGGFLNLEQVGYGIYGRSPGKVFSFPIDVF